MLNRLEDAAVDFVRDYIEPGDVYEIDRLVEVVKDYIKDYYTPEDIFSKKELLEWYESLDD